MSSLLARTSARSSNSPPGEAHADNARVKPYSAATGNSKEVPEQRKAPSTASASVSSAIVSHSAEMPASLEIHRSPPSGKLSQGRLFSEKSSASSRDSSLRDERLPAGISRDEMNLAEFPLTVLSTRVDPKVKTLEFSDYQRGKDGELTERKWIITGADKFGLPTATDDDVILGLIRLTMDDGFRGRKVYFTRYELLRALQWSTEGRSYTRLVKSLDRLSGVRIRASNAFYDNSSKSYQTKNFGILDAYELNDNRSAKKISAYQRAADEEFESESIVQDPNHPSEDGKRSYFIWSEMLFNSFRSGFIKKLDLDLYFSLRSSVARRLYRYLDKHFYFRPVVEKPILFLAFEKLGISRNYKYVSSVKQQLEPAAEELVANGYLAGFEFFGKGEQAIARFVAAEKGEGSAAAGRKNFPPHRSTENTPRTGSSAGSDISNTKSTFSRGNSPAASSASPLASAAGPASSTQYTRGSKFPGEQADSEHPSRQTRFPGRAGGAPSSQREGRGVSPEGDYRQERHFESEAEFAEKNARSFGEQEAVQDEHGLRSQLVEALVSRGISLAQVKRLLTHQGLGELEQVDSIISYYDFLVENHDPKVSRNKVGFLYRAVESPLRFQIPQSFLSRASGQFNQTTGPQAVAQTVAQTAAGQGGNRQRYGERQGARHLDALPHIRNRLQNLRGSSSEAGISTNQREDENFRLARLRTEYFEFVSGEVQKILASQSEKQREEVRRRVEEKMSCLGTVLSPERFEEAVQGCIREEISRTHNIPDFRKWQQMKAST